MIHITDKSKCCGCHACVQRCPKHCITMEEDEEGFLYPKIDESSCIDCGLCEKVCPVPNPSSINIPLKVYAAKNNNENQRLRSSSGGIFILLAEEIIKQGGVVFGAHFDKNWEVEHVSAETFNELIPLMRSKYVQSRIGNTYKKAESFLKQGRKVLFVGTSCQIAGLKKFLGKDYERLLAVDFICHGVPSPGVWRKYLNELKTPKMGTNGQNTVLPSSQESTPIITGVNFREKQLGGYEWSKYGFVISTKSYSDSNQKSIMLSVSAEKDPYMRAFLTNHILRPSCYVCPAKNGASSSDITIADYWGVEKCHPKFIDKIGVSMIACHTKKGVDAVTILNAQFVESTIEDASKINISYKISSKAPVSRDKFFNFLNSGKSVAETVDIVIPYQKPLSNFQKIIHLPKRIYSYIIRNM